MSEPNKEYLKRLLDQGLNEGKPSGEPDSEFVKAAEAILRETNTPEKQEKARLKAEMLDLHEAVKERMEFDPKRRVLGGSQGEVTITESRVGKLTVRAVSGDRMQPYSEIYYKGGSHNFDAMIRSDGSFFLKITPHQRGHIGRTIHHRIDMMAADEISGTTPRAITRFTQIVTKAYLKPITPSA